jgi:4-hydroxy-tetrahydrodipicolinate synthase
MDFGLTAVMKATANYLGLPAGLPYPPYVPVSGERLDALHRFLATCLTGSVSGHDHPIEL